MLDRLTQIPELYNLRHRHDESKHTPFDAESNLFKRLFSNVMFRNPKLADFLTQFQSQAVVMLESVLVIRNYFNYSVSKYWNGHLN